MNDKRNYKKIIYNVIKNIEKRIRNTPKRIKIICIFVLLLSLICCLSFWGIRESQKQKYVIYDGENLKENKYPGYKALIDNLQEKHPNWNFTLFYTKLDWEEVIKSEGHHDNVQYPLNLIPDSLEYPEDWKCEIDRDKTFDNGTWLCASDKAIKYQMDPRNILNEDNIFQFVELQYVKGAQTEDGIHVITKGSFLEGDSISKALIQAGEKAHLDSYFIASRLIQEQGRRGTILSRGCEYNDTIVYNPFNINAKGNSQQEIIGNAAKYAYEQGWDTLETALVEGVDFLKESYINVGQNTLYLQKFDVVNQHDSLYTHQYMQNLLAPQSEANNMKEIYKASDTVDASLNFIIPLYENMPKEISKK